MKIKQHLGETVNGFKILDSYEKTTPSGGKTRKVLLKCEDCGSKFERQSGSDFQHIKCKCKCKTQSFKPTQHIGETINGYKILDTYAKVTQNGKIARKTLFKCEKCGEEFERSSNTNPQHIKYRCECIRSIPHKTNRHFVEWEGEQITLSELSRISGIPIETIRYKIKNGMAPKEATQKEYENICEICGKKFIHRIKGKKYCSITCSNRANHGKGKYKDYVLICIVCGKEFKGSRFNAKTCSKKCNHAYCSATRKKRYKKLQQAGLYDYSITLEAVYKKFEGKCNCCHKEIDFNCNRLSNDYPSIDHIIPLSKGGNHTWDNVQLLCRKCNFIKGAKLEQQIS